MFQGGHMQAFLVFSLSVLCCTRSANETSNGTKATENSTKTPDPTSPTTNHTCLEIMNGTVCVKCVAGYMGERCDKCETGWYGNLTKPEEYCQLCDCNGNLDLRQSDSCHHVTGACQKCRPNTSGQHCEKCSEGFHGDAIIAKNCTRDVASFSFHHTRKERLIIIVCSVLGLCCLFGIAVFLYCWWKKRIRKERGPFWKVELSNRNYDDLDFSLLDPITDTPLVYRADIAGFDEDALLVSEKPQLILDTEDETFA